jgi:hypothetical protein
VASRTADGKRGADNGTIDYPVRPPGSMPPPAFAVLPQPAAARAGERVSVSHVSLLDDVTITGCAVGFEEDNLASCHPTAQGWVADIAVPPETTAGPGTLQWRVTYQRAEKTGATDGLLTFTVLDPAAGGGGFWRQLLPIAGRVLLGGALLAGLIATRGIRTRVVTFLKRFFGTGNPAGADADMDGAVNVVALSRSDSKVVNVKDTDAWPVHLIRVSPQLDPRLWEEKP